MVVSNEDKEFHLMLANATSEIIAKKFNISFKQASNLFKSSKIFDKLINSTDEFDQMMPSDLYNLWKNERLTSIPVTDADIENGILRKMRLK